MRHLDPRKHSCVCVSDPRKLHVSVYENAQTIVMWLLPVLYRIDTQNAVCMGYVLGWSYFFIIVEFWEEAGRGSEILLKNMFSLKKNFD